MAFECTKFEAFHLGAAFSAHRDAVRRADKELHAVVRLAVESRGLDPAAYGVRAEDGVFSFVARDEPADEPEQLATESNESTEE